MTALEMPQFQGLGRIGRTTLVLHAILWNSDASPYETLGDTLGAIRELRCPASTLLHPGYSYVHGSYCHHASRMQRIYPMESISQHCLGMAAGSPYICPSLSQPNRDHFTGTRRGKHNAIAGVLRPSPKTLRVSTKAKAVTFVHDSNTSKAATRTCRLLRCKRLIP